MRPTSLPVAAHSTQETYDIIIVLGLLTSYLNTAGVAVCTTLHDALIWSLCNNTRYLDPQRNEFEGCNFHQEAYQYDDRNVFSHWMEIQVNHTVGDGYITIDWTSLVRWNNASKAHCNNKRRIVFLQVAPHALVPMCKIDERTVRIGQRLPHHPIFWNAGCGPDMFMSFLFPNGTKVLDGQLFNFSMDYVEESTVRGEGK